MAKGGGNAKVHAVRDGTVWPTCFTLTAGNANDRAASMSLVDKMLVGAKTLLADMGCDAEEIRGELKKKKVRRAFS